MTDGERLEDMEAWLAQQYEMAFAIWGASESPATRARQFIQLQTLEAVARHLLTGHDGPVYVLNERVIIFTRHFYPGTRLL